MASTPSACSPPAAPKSSAEDLLAAPKLLAEDPESHAELQSSDTVLDLRLLAGASAGSRQHSLTQSSDCETTPLPSSGCSSPRLSEQTDACACADPAEPSGWQEACALLDKGLAALLLAGTTVITTELKVAECSVDEASHNFRLRTEASCSSMPLAEACCSRIAEANLAALLKGDDVHGLARALAPGTVVGRSWSTQLLPIGPAPMTAASNFASQALEALQHVAPEELLPTAASNWLAHGPLATAAVQLQLRGASGLVPLQPATAGLQIVSLLIPLGARSQAAAGVQSRVQPGQQMLLAPEEHQALKGRSGGWQLSLAGDGSEPAVCMLGPAVEQVPGQLIVQQAQARCCLAEGSLTLCWNVASGAEWPAQALEHGTACSDALREAAVAARNPWHAAESGAAQQLHVLRLLFFAACSIPKVHGDVLAGLQRHLLPLCRRELATQAANVLPQMNARPGCLEDASPGGMRCSCCGGEFAFSYVRLIERREERAGELCWTCWDRRQDIGLCDAGPPRNARNCTVIPPRDVQRLICLLERGTPAKRAAPDA